MKRYQDIPKHTFSPYRSDLQVKCPDCGGLAVITAAGGHRTLQCTSCLRKKHRQPDCYYIRLRGQCPCCEYYYRIDLQRSTAYNHPTMWTDCPRCGQRVKGTVAQSICDGFWRKPVRGGREPYFGCPLYFRTEFRGNCIWAYNREHLAYLIAYLEAELREKPHREGYTPKTQSDELPQFMKTAKNRRAIVRALKKLQAGE